MVCSSKIFFAPLSNARVIKLHFRILSIRTMKLSKKFSRNWQNFDLRKLEKMKNHAFNRLPRKTIKINSISKMDMILTIQESLSGVTKNKFKGRVPSSKIAAIPFLDTWLSSLMHLPTQKTKLYDSLWRHFSFLECYVGCLVRRNFWYKRCRPRRKTVWACPENSCRMWIFKNGIDSRC